MKAAAGTCDITPRIALPLAGLSRRPGAWDAIADRLEANAVVLRDEVTTVALVSIDVLYIGEDLRRRILADLGGRLTSADLFLAASHTHFAPAVAGPPQIGVADVGYVAFVASEIAALLRRLLDEPATDCALRYGEAPADHAVNRRLSGRFRPNMWGPRDETIRAVHVAGDGGNVIAVGWSYACHPVNFPRDRSVSAEYPGVARSVLRAKAGAGLPVLFFMGFAGNTRPRLIRTPIDRGVRTTSRLLNRHHWEHPGEEGWTTWAQSLAHAVANAADVASRAKPIGGPLRTWRSERSASWAYEDGGAAPSLPPFSLHRVSVGDGLVLAGVSAEPMVEYGLDLVAAAPRRTHTVPVGCIDATFGYIPTAGMLREGGYEVDGFRDAYAIPMPFDPAVEKRFRGMLGELVPGGAPANPVTRLRRRAATLLAAKVSRGADRKAPRAAPAEAETPPRPSPPRDIVTRERLARALREAGVREGDQLAIGVSLSAIGWLEQGPATLIEALIEVLGEGGTFMIPAYSKMYAQARVVADRAGKTDIFDRSTPANTGAMPNRMLTWPGVLRSTHPTNSMAAWGANAALITEGHTPASGAYSPYSRLAALGGRYLAIGIDDRLVGLRHEAQALAGLLSVVPKPMAVRYRTADGAIRIFTRHDPGGCLTRLPDLVAEMRAAGMVTDTRVINAEARLVDVADALAFMTERLNRAPERYLCDAEGCLWCREVERRLHLSGRVLAPAPFQRSRLLRTAIMIENRPRLQGRQPLWRERAASAVLRTAAYRIRGYPRSDRRVPESGES